MSEPRRQLGRAGLAAGLAAALGLALAACGASAPSGSPVATTVVDLPTSYRFSPAAIEVPAGATVTWTNHDNFSHSVQVLDGSLAGAPHLMKPGESTQLTFTSPGLVHYQCSLHPQQMQGTVLVQGG